jgi:hypothetical protein
MKASSGFAPTQSFLPFILFQEISMSVFKLPLSGDVNQWINPVTSWWSGNQISVNLGEAGSPETEAEILRRVGSYGRQLGRITDAMIVLLRHLPRDANFTQEEQDAFAAFKKMADHIADIKEKHNRQAMRTQTPQANFAPCPADPLVD